MFIFYKLNIHLSKIGGGFRMPGCAECCPISEFPARQAIIYRLPGGMVIEMEIQGLGKIVIVAGVVLTVVGVLMLLAPKLPFIGKLPGDLYFKRDGVSFYFPLATSIIVSVILSLVISFLFRGK